MSRIEMLVASHWMVAVLLYALPYEDGDDVMDMLTAIFEAAVY